MHTHSAHIGEIIKITGLILYIVTMTA